ncbi:hypothetical protein BH09SUM1_BH09SUM1_16120 [soil metagenome]
MTGKPKPKPSFLDEQDYYGVREGRKVWRSLDGLRFFTWDSLHGEMEAFNTRGKHIASLDAVTGKPIKGPVLDRRLKL